MDGLEACKKKANPSKSLAVFLPVRGSIPSPSPTGFSADPSEVRQVRPEECGAGLRAVATCRSNEP